MKPSRARDAGIRLVERLIAIVILGGGVVAVLAGYGTLVRASAAHTEQVETTNSLTNVAEALALAPYATGCTQAVYDADIAAAIAATGSDSAVDATITYWDGDSFEPTCLDSVVAARFRIQQIELEATYRRSTETLSITKRSDS